MNNFADDGATDGRDTSRGTVLPAVPWGGDAGSLCGPFPARNIGLPLLWLFVKGLTSSPKFWEAVASSEEIKF